MVVGNFFVRNRAIPQVRDIVAELLTGHLGYRLEQDVGSTQVFIRGDHTLGGKFLSALGGTSWQSAPIILNVNYSVDVGSTRVVMRWTIPDWVTASGENFQGAAHIEFKRVQACVDEWIAQNPVEAPPMPLPVEPPAPSDAGFSPAPPAEKVYDPQTAQPYSYESGPPPVPLPPTLEVREPAKPAAARPKPVSGPPQAKPVPKPAPAPPPKPTGHADWAQWKQPAAEAVAKPAPEVPEAGRPKWTWKSEVARAERAGAVVAQQAQQKADVAAQAKAEAKAAEPVHVEPPPTDPMTRLHHNAESGDAKSQAWLGWCYDEGLGVAEDKTQAAKWYLAAAEQGDLHAQLNIAACYATGEGVAENPAEALRWYRASAEQGDPKAISYVAWCCERGVGTPIDRAEAAKWYHLAADQGDAHAQLKLGRFYARGTGVPRDRHESRKWLHKAADAGNAKAREILDEEHSILTAAGREPILMMGPGHHHPHHGHDDTHGHEEKHEHAEHPYGETM